METCVLNFMKLISSFAIFIDFLYIPVQSMSAVIFIAMNFSAEKMENDTFAVQQFQHMSLFVYACAFQSANLAFVSHVCCVYEASKR